MKKISLLTTIVVAVVTSNFAWAQCRAIPDCPDCAHVVNYDDGQILVYGGRDLPTDIGTNNGISKRYRGGSNDRCLTFGPYLSRDASKVWLEPTITLSSNWKPDQWQSCRKRNYRGKCVGWNWRNHETGFTIDYVANGDLLYEHVFKNMNSMSKHSMTLPKIKCDGPISRLEVRVCKPYGGQIDLSVDQLELDLRFNH